MKNFFVILTMALMVISTWSCAKEEEYSVVGSIYGTITDSETNQPVQGASVSISPTNASTTTGSDGSFKFQDLEAGQYKVTVSKSGYTYNSNQVNVVAGQSVMSDIVITPEVDIVGFTLSSSSLVFGTSYSELTFTITNNSNSSSNTWSISGIDVDWLSVSPSTGSIGIGESSAVKVSIDRAKITDSVMSYFIVNAGGGSESILVTASESSTGTGDGDDSSSDSGATSGSLSVSTSTLAFGEYLDQLTFTISNTGSTSFDFGLMVDDVAGALISGSPTSGTIAPSSSTDVTIYLNRSSLYGEQEGVLTVVAGSESWKITITAYEPIDYGTVTTPDRTLEASVTNVEVSGTKAYVDFRLINSDTETHSQFRLGEPNTGEQLYAIDDLYNTYEFTNYSNYAINLNINGATINDAGDIVSNVFSAGGVINGTVVIDGVDSSASKFTTVAIGVYAYGSTNNYHGQITFSNVPIIR